MLIVAQTDAEKEAVFKRIERGELRVFQASVDRAQWTFFCAEPPEPELFGGNGETAE